MTSLSCSAAFDEGRLGVRLANVKKQLAGAVPDSTRSQTICDSGSMSSPNG